MARWTSREARTSRFMPAMRELVRCYQAFERFDAGLHREHGLTPSQADVLFSLGNTDGMTCKEIGERTLITKGTLTGILDRMEGKGLLDRVPSVADGRSTVVVLTRAGAELFEEVYPPHIAALKKRFGKLSAEEMDSMQAILAKLRNAFE